MNITYIASSAIPSKSANSVHVMKMCQAFAKHGHKVTLLVPDRKDDIDKCIVDVFSYYNVDKCFDIVYVPWINFKGRGYIYGVLASLKANKLKSDLVFCRNLFGALFSSIIKLPIVLELHQPIKYQGKLHEQFFKYIVKRANFKSLIVITKALEKHFKEHYTFISTKIKVAPDGADLINENTKPIVLRNKDKRLQIGYSGSLFEGKGMEIISQLVPICDWVDFHIIGGDEISVIFWKNELKDYSNIDFYGFLPQKEVSRYIISFDILLLPNQVSVKIGNDDIGKWTSPLKLFEYMSASKPIISSDLEVLREILNENNSILVPHNNPDAWVDAIKSLENMNLRKKLSKNAYDDIKTKYTWYKRAGNII